MPDQSAAGESLAHVATDLYARGPGEFVAARNAAAGQAQAAGQRELAGAIKALRRPSAGAWLVNLLVRECGDELDELLQLGDALRAATAAMAGDQLRQLSRERRRLLEVTTAAAVRLGATADYRLTDAARRELTSTLDAGLADEAAAGAIRTGRLVRSLASTGFDPVDLDGAVAAPDGHRLLAPRAHLHSVAGGASTDTGPMPDPRAARQAAVLDEARNRVALAERALVRADAQHSGADERLGQVRERVAQAEQALRSVRAELAAAQEAVQRAGEQRDVARHERDQTRQALRRLERRET